MPTREEQFGVVGIILHLLRMYSQRIKCSGIAPIAYDTEKFVSSYHPVDDMIPDFSFLEMRKPIHKTGFHYHDANLIPIDALILGLHKHHSL